MIPYNIDSSSINYKRYYENQAGGLMPIFRGTTLQRGNGLGGLFSNLLKGIGPMLKEGAMTVGKQLLNTGVNIANDVIQGKSFGESAKSNLIAGGKNLLGTLSTAMRGGAYKKRKASMKNKNKIKKRRLTNDIFQ